VYGLNVTYPSSRYNFRSIVGTDGCHHFQSCASDVNFFPEAASIRVES